MLKICKAQRIAGHFLVSPLVYRFSSGLKVREAHMGMAMEDFICETADPVPSDGVENGG